MKKKNPLMNYYKMRLPVSGASCSSGVPGSHWGGLKGKSLPEALLLRQPLAGRVPPVETG